MKKITCEMCGSTDLLKEDGVFVCQSCGTKYSKEEAKKMMIEGSVDVSGSTVKVDQSQNVENLVSLAEKAMEVGNDEEALLSLDKALEIDCNNAKAWFLKGNITANTYSFKVVSDIEKGNRNIRENVNLEKSISYYNNALSFLDSKEMKIDIINNLATSCVNIYKDLLFFILEYSSSTQVAKSMKYITSLPSGIELAMTRSGVIHRKIKKEIRLVKSYFNDFINEGEKDEDILNSVDEARKAIIESKIEILEKLKDKIWRESIDNFSLAIYDDINLPNDLNDVTARKLEEFIVWCKLDIMENCFVNNPFSQQKVLKDLYKNYLETVISAYRICASIANSVEDVNKYIGRILYFSRKFHEIDETYSVPSKESLEEIYFKEEKEEVEKQSDGCYVATAVYGSYDCPQVWTLRRFRDYELASTFYGRAFIHIYYAVSPTAVKLFGDTKWFNDFFKARLDKMVSSLNEKGIEDTEYEDRDWK